MAFTLSLSRLRMTQAKYFGRPWSASGSVASVDGGNGIVATPSPIIAAGNLDLGPLTADWDAGNFDVNARNSTDWVNAVTAGADPTGVADSTAALQAAIDALPDGGTLFIPAGIYKLTATLTVGDGSAAAPSTYNFISIVGANPGHSSGEQNPLGGGTEFHWYGAAGGTMMQVLGPISSVDIQGLHFNCKPGADAAATAVEFIHLFNSKVTHLSAINHTGVAYILTALLAVPDNATNFEQVLFSDVVGTYGTGTAYGALLVGGTDAATDGAISRLSFVNCLFRGGATSRAAVELRFCDNFVWAGVNMTSFSYGLRVRPPAGGTNMPVAHAFYNCFIFGSTDHLIVDTVDALWIPPTGVGAMFFPWCSDNGTAAWAPPHSGFKAIADDGNAYLEGGFFSKNAAAIPAPLVANTQVQVANADATPTTVEVAAFGDAPFVNFRRSAGTAAAPTATQTGQGIVNLLGYGYGATGWSAANRGGFQLITNENWTDAAQGTQVQISATATGTTTVNTPLTITGTPAVGVNTTTPTRTLDLNGTQRFRGIAAPAVSEANSGTIYFDSTSNTLKASLNGGAYVNVIGSAGLTGSGVLGNVATWSAATDLTNASDIWIDTANNRLGVQVAAPAYAIDVDGDINFTAPNGIRMDGDMFLRGVAASGATPGWVSLGTAISASIGTGCVSVGDETTPSASGNKNTMIGSRAGTALTTGTENVAVGYNSGSTITTGTNNIFIGSETDASAGNLTNAVAIGYGVTVGASDSMALGDSSMKVGIRTTTPAAALDVDGVVATRHADVILVNGLNSDIDIKRSWNRITGPTGAFGLGGFANGVDGYQLTVFNTTAQAMTIHNLDGGSAAANQILTLTGVDVVLAARTSSATFIYEDAQDKWILVSYNG